MRHTRHFLLPLLTLSLLGAALAQELSAEEVLDKLEARTENLQDASFLITGTLFDTDAQEIALEIETQFVPDEELVRALFIQPDALADNFIIIDGDTVYNYLFVTNQVSIFNANDPDALGGLLPEVQDEVEGRVSVTPDLNRIFGEDAWEASVEGYDTSPEGSVYTLRFNNTEEGVNVDYVDATVLEGEWLPQSLEFVKQDGTTLARINFENYLLDSGLEPAELRAIPPDAEQIDER